MLIAFETPVWAQVLLLSAAVLAALGAIWKIIKSGFKGASKADRMLSLLEQLDQKLDAPYALDILKEVVAQVRTDSGSTIKDAVNRLDKAAADNSATAIVLASQVEAVKQLAAADRAEAAKLTVLVQQVLAEQARLRDGAA